MLPAGLRGFALSSNSPFDPVNENSSNGEFYLHPHYRAERPLDKTLLRVQAGLDGFVSEKYYDQIALILAEWSSRGPCRLQTQAIEIVLSADFAGSSMIPVESRPVRTGPPIEVHQNKFVPNADLGREAFLQAWRSSVSVFFEDRIRRVSSDEDASDSGVHISDSTATEHSRALRVNWDRSRISPRAASRILGSEWESRPSSSSPEFTAPEFRLRRWQARDRPGAVPPLQFSQILLLLLWGSILRTRLSYCGASTAGGRFSMVPAASTSMDTTEYPSLTSTTMASTISTSANPRVFLIDSTETVATEHSKTLPRHQAWEFSTTRLALSSPILITRDVRM